MVPLFSSSSTSLGRTSSSSRMARFVSASPPGSAGGVKVGSGFESPGGDAIVEQPVIPSRGVPATATLVCMTDLLGSEIPTVYCPGSGVLMQNSLKNRDRSARTARFAVPVLPVIEVLARRAKELRGAQRNYLLPIVGSHFARCILSENAAGLPSRSVSTVAVKSLPDRAYVMRFG